jgi:hypothetical protein
MFRWILAYLLGSGIALALWLMSVLPGAATTIADRRRNGKYPRSG